MSQLFNEGHTVFEGIVTHERFSPKQHAFRYKLFYLLIDLDKIDQLNSLSPLWSVNKFNLVQFRRSDYMHAEPESGCDGDLKKAVIEIIFKKTKEHFNGKVFLLSNLRYWGYCFNPVSYYFCFDHEGELQYIIDEVTNTPWKERHQYVHKITDSFAQAPTDEDSQDKAKTNSHKNNNRACNLVFNFEKTFHVSPFMPMDMMYKSKYVMSDNKLLIHMDLFKKPVRKNSSREKEEQQQQKRTQQKQVEKTFFATMNLTGEPLTKTKANALPFQFPFQCSKIFFSIYWQALKLWGKGVPFHSHPKK